MPFFDSERQLLVVRIVYDGPPMAGKTTTLRSLARRLGAPEVSSPAEANGRTTFFDWTEYVGGLYEGRQIRCQIVSVPGQLELKHRREFLLKSADAVVFVADTRASALPRSLALLEELAPHCRGQQPPLGMVFQANKRDADEALPTPVLRRMLAAISPMVLIETVATDGDGVREAFVLAVRLALDRVRPLMPSAGEETPRQPAAGPDELMSQLLALDRPGSTPGSNTTSEAVSLLAQIAPASPAERRTALVPNFTPGAEVEKVFVPNTMMPGGRIWPPVDGRALLHEVNALGLVPVRTASGDWWAAGGGWWIHSAVGAIFDDLDAARQRLIDGARLHCTLGQRLSNGRVLLLADAGVARQRIWQLVRAERSLQARLSAAVDAPVPELAHELCLIAARLLEARALFYRSSVPLACTLETVSDELGRVPRFVGLVPMEPGSAPRELGDDALLTRELGPALAALVRRRDDAAELAAWLRAKRPNDVANRVLAHMLESQRAARAGADA
jgi:signal recognition particle receptor subunit beta